MPAAVRSPAQVDAARRNGTRSRGPVTPDGKARSAMNALKHGLRAERFRVLGTEDVAECDGFFTRVRADLGPAGEAELGVAEAVAAAWWRAQRADRLEAELLGAARVWGEREGQGSAGARLARDDGALRALAGIVRYRAQAEAEARRGLDLLTRLRRERAAAEAPDEPGPGPADEPEGAAPTEPDAAREPAAANSNEAPSGPGDMPDEPDDVPAATSAAPNKPEPALALNRAQRRRLAALERRRHPPAARGCPARATDSC